MGQQRFTVVRAWIFYAEIALWPLALVMAVAGKLRWAAAVALVALGLDMTGRLWSRRSRVPMPYFMRWFLLLPRGPQSPSRLREVLQPCCAERILEVGSGVGVHALPIAASLLPDGVLEVLDIQQDMLDDLMKRAARSGLTNIVARQGDARRLPYADSTFDAAYLVGVLGEIPDASIALRELHRVLKPGGRLVVAEVVIDPDFIRLSKLQAMASDAVFAFDRHAGPRFAYCAVFRRWEPPNDQSRRTNPAQAMEARR